MDSNLAYSTSSSRHIYVSACKTVSLFGDTEYQQEASFAFITLLWEPVLDP